MFFNIASDSSSRINPGFKVATGMAVSAVTICTAIIVFYKRILLNSVFRLVIATGLLTSVIMLQYSAFAIPIINKYDFRRPVAAIVNKSVPGGQTIYVLKSGYQPFLFYVRQPLKYLLDYDQINDNVHYLLVEKHAP